MHILKCIYAKEKPYTAKSKEKKYSNFSAIVTQNIQFTEHVNELDTRLHSPNNVTYTTTTKTTRVCNTHTHILYIGAKSMQTANYIRQPSSYNRLYIKINKTQNHISQ